MNAFQVCTVIYCKGGIFPIMEALANERNLGEYKRVVSQIRKSIKRLSTQEMADYFDVTEENCAAVINCIQEHPDWDDEQIAEEIYW